MVEGQDSFKLHYAEETDSGSSYHECEEGTQDCDVAEGSQETQSKSAYVRNVEAINIDCLTPHNIKNEQDNQSNDQTMET